MEKEAYLDPGTVELRKLIADHDMGRIAIPEFQRQYVWKPSKAAALLDSLYRRFPVGSLLFWRTTGAVEPRKKLVFNLSEAEWIIDGQQRTTTLSRVKSGELDIWFHVRDEIFRRGAKKFQKSRLWYPVADIWNDHEHMRIQQGLSWLPETQAQEFARNLDKVRKILDYMIPVVRMVDHSHASAVAAFERINTKVVKLSRADLESANIAARHTAFIRERVQPVVERIHDNGFDRLSVTHLFRVCGFVAHPDGRRRTPLHDLSPKDVRSAWKRTEAGVDKVLALLDAELGIRDMRLVWSGPLLVPAVALLATRGPKDIDHGELVAWLALASLYHRYSKSSETVMEQDLKACRSADPIRSLLKNLKEHRSDLTARPNDFSGRIADRGGLFGLYVALRHRGAVDFFSHGKISAHKGIHRHHIVPRGRFSTEEQPKADTLANVAFVLGGTNESLGSDDPAVYLPNLTPKTRASQCIPEDEGLWSMEAASRFWAARRDLVAEAFNEFLRERMTARRLR